MKRILSSVKRTLMKRNLETIPNYSAGNNERSTVTSRRDLIHDCRKSFYCDQDDR